MGDRPKRPEIRVPYTPESPQQEAGKPVAESRLGRQGMEGVYPLYPLVTICFGTNALS